MKNVLMAALLLLTMSVMPAALSAGAAEGGEKILGEKSVGMAFISAAAVVGLGTIAAGIAVGLTGSAAVGVLAEKPELIGKLLIIVGLAEGIAIYGLIIAIMILGKI